MRNVHARSVSSAMIARPFARPAIRLTERPAESRAARWSAVASRAIYFGHQSVGEQIVAGVERLDEELSLGLRIVKTRDTAIVIGPAFVHFLAGKNEDPASKNASLLSFLDARPSPDRAIVLLKYCYVDIQTEADVAPLFNEYRKTVAAIRLKHPDVIVVHTTIPLTTVDTALRAGVKRVLGRRTARQGAVARHCYNELVRATFGDHEPTFDIARAEATRANGTHESVMIGGVQIETLARENTYDGGHLNPRGQRAVASTLLELLSTVIEDGR